MSTDLGEGLGEFDDESDIEESSWDDLLIKDDDDNSPYIMLISCISMRVNYTDIFIIFCAFYIQKPGLCQSQAGAKLWFTALAWPGV